MSGEIPELEGIIYNYNVKLVESGVTVVYRNILEAWRELELSKLYQNTDEAEQLDEDYRAALSMENRLVARPLHDSEPDDSGAISVYFLSQIGQDGIELIQAMQPMATLQEDGSIAPLDNEGIVPTQEQAELVAEYSNQLEKAGWRRH